MRHLSLVTAAAVIAAPFDTPPAAGDDVEVVFVYGDYGPGGLTVTEASNLARALETEGAQIH